MYRIVDVLIQGYQIFFSPFLHQLLGIQAGCRFEETCSHYARRVIRKYGILYGTKLTVKRLLACQPFKK